jgi:hypothetical protein
MRFFIISISIYILMSYDKYIKYKNKYLQLKAKYTQVGGGLMWTINNLSQYGLPVTTPITQEESNAILKRMQLSENRSVNIDSKTLLNVSGNKINDYGYTINSDGITGTRNSKRGKYDMTLKESTPPPAPTASSVFNYHPSTPPPSASYRYPLPSSASGASYRSPPASSASYSHPFTPPPPVSHIPYQPPSASSASAKILDLEKEFPDLPTFMSIKEIKNPNVPPYIGLVVEWNDLFFLDTNDTKIRNDIEFKRINDKQVDMTFRGKKYSLINNGDPSIWIHRFN